MTITENAAPYIRPATLQLKGIPGTADSDVAAVDQNVVISSPNHSVCFSVFADDGTNILDADQKLQPGGHAVVFVPAGHHVSVWHNYGNVTDTPVNPLYRTPITAFINPE